MSKKSSKAVDGVSTNPAHAITSVVRYTDWEVLEREFMMNLDYPNVNTWLREVKGWLPNKIRSGRTIKMIKGWSAKRAQMQQTLTDVALNELLAEERRRIPELRKAKMNLVARIITDIGRWDRLSSTDKQLCYQILKVELGEPTNPNNIKPQATRDPVEALLEEYGLMKNGQIIDDKPSEDSRLIGSNDSGESTTADSSTPAEVPQT